MSQEKRNIVEEEINIVHFPPEILQNILSKFNKGNKVGEGYKGDKDDQNNINKFKILNHQLKAESEYSQKKHTNEIQKKELGFIIENLILILQGNRLDAKVEELSKKLSKLNDNPKIKKAVLKELFLIEKTKISSIKDHIKPLADLYEPLNEFLKKIKEEDLNDSMLWPEFFSLLEKIRKEVIVNTAEDKKKLMGAMDDFHQKMSNELGVDHYNWLKFLYTQQEVLNTKDLITSKLDSVIPEKPDPTIKFKQIEISSFISPILSRLRESLGVVATGLLLLLLLPLLGLSVTLGLGVIAVGIGIFITGEVEGLVDLKKSFDNLDEEIKRTNDDWENNKKPAKDALSSIKNFFLELKISELFTDLPVEENKMEKVNASNDLNDKGQENKNEIRNGKIELNENVSESTKNENALGLIKEDYFPDELTNQKFITTYQGSFWKNSTNGSGEDKDDNLQINKSNCILL